MKISLSSFQIGSFFALCSAFLFSTKAIFIKQTYALSPLVDGTVLMALRMLSALPFFLLICWFNRHHNQGIKKEGLANFNFCRSVRLLLCQLARFHGPHVY